MINNIFVAVCLGILLSAVTVLGDIFVKNASIEKDFSGWKLLVVGAFLYGVTAIGWFFVFRSMKVSTVAILYSVSAAILLVLVGILYYREGINHTEIVGIILGLFSIILLVK